MQKLKPKMFSVMKTYTKQQFFKDLLAGIIVAIIALPLNIAFALGSGVSAEKGIYAAIIASIICGILGGSRVQISGPTGAFIVITQSVLCQFGAEGLAISMLIAGIILILLGVFKLGKLVRFIPAPITTGFTAGIGVTIFTLEIKDFLGLAPQSMPTKFLDKWAYYISNLDQANIQSVILALVCIVILVVWPKISKTIPNSLIAIIVGTLAAKLLQLDVPLLGEIPKSLGAPTLPTVTSLQTIFDLVSPGFTIAVLIAMQALLSAVVTDGMINSRTNTNMELIAQGIANITLGFFGCIPTTGGVARGVQSAKNGARTPIASIVHSIMLFVFLILLMPLIKMIPLCVLSAILIVVSYNMLNVKVLKGYLKAPKSDLVVLIASCVLTFAFDLVFAIEVGMIMSLILFMRRMAEVTDIKEWEYDNENTYDLDRKVVPQGTAVFEITGPLFFGAADTLKKIVVDQHKKCFIIRMRGVGTIDATALNYLENLYDDCKRVGIQIVFSHVNDQPLSVMKKSGFYDKVGEENFCTHIDAAIKRAEDLQ